MLRSGLPTQLPIHHSSQPVASQRLLPHRLGRPGWPRADWRRFSCSVQREVITVLATAGFQASLWASCRPPAIQGNRAKRDKAEKKKPVLVH